MSLINGTTTFQRKVTADLIAEYVRDRILEGTFAPSTSINEVQLAARLDISRGAGPRSSSAAGSGGVARQHTQPRDISGGPRARGHRGRLHGPRCH